MHAHKNCGRHLLLQIPSSAESTAGMDRAISTAPKFLRGISHLVLMDNFRKTHPPAVVLDSPHHVGLGITRSLGRLGVRVYNVDSSRWAPAFYSRYCAGASKWNFETASPAESVNFLMKLAEQIGGPSVLLPTTDTTAMFVAEHREALEERFLFVAPSAPLVRSLCKKDEMQALARKAGIAVPDTNVPRTREDLLSCFQRATYPLMIKSIDSRFRKAKSKTKVFVRTREEALVVYEQIRDGIIGNLLVQDWIPMGAGTDWMFNGYFDRQSECIASFTGRKLRQYPPHIGVTSFGVCERNEVLEDIAIGFLKSLRYQGGVDMDFRYDERDGRYKLLDVNPRIGGSFRLFTSEDGIDIARMLYLDQTGHSLARTRVKEGRRWAVEDYDLVTGLEYVREGSLSLRSWLNSLRSVDEFGFLSMDDALPTLFMLRDDLAELIGLLRNRKRPVQPFENNAGPGSMEFPLATSIASRGETYDRNVCSFDCSTRHHSTGD